MGIQLDQIPGLTEAVAAAREIEDALRVNSFLDVPFDICGIEVLQFRPRHFQHLCAVRSPFFYPPKKSAEAADAPFVDWPAHIAQFFWIISPAFSERLIIADPDSAAIVRDAYLADLVRRLPLDEIVIPEIEAYIEEAFFDQPAGAHNPSAVPIASFEACLCHELAEAYGWTWDQIREQPFARLFQLLRLIRRDEAAKVGVKIPFINRLSDRAKRLALDAWRRLNPLPPKKPKPAPPTTQDPKP